MGETTTSRNRLIGLLVGVVLILGLVACGAGGGHAKPPPGSPDNPLVGKLTGNDEPTGEPSSRPTTPGYKALVERQRRTPVAQDPSNPCALVSKAQAQVILRAKLLEPVVAPQGPTCIYRDRSGRSFATLSIQPLRLDRLRPQIRRLHRVDVLHRTAYCGVLGQPMLYLALPHGQVLSVAAQCDAAARFARRAAPRLLPRRDK